MGQAYETDGAGIVIAPQYTKLYSREHIDICLNLLSTHQDHERNAEHLFCKRLQKCNLILHQVIGSIPTGKV